MTQLSADIVGRYEHLTQRASKLRGRTATDRSKALFVVGGASVSLGLALVLLGYLGASHTIYVFEQIPYLISGGILGGCLVIAGGFCYFAFWLTRLHAEMAGTRASNERIEQLLTTLLEKS
jgi:Na+/melibiose symporter-like transporter